jgi:hypothetical protein
MVKKSVQRGRSEVHGAKNNERHVCGRRRDGEPAVSWRRCHIILIHPPRACQDRLFPVGGTLRLQAMREQSWRTFSTSC